MHDAGVGVKEERRVTLFDRGKRTRTVGTDDERGAGVALLFCADFVTKLGGSVGVESTEGQGTVFTVTLPNAEDDQG